MSEKKSKSKKKEMQSVYDSVMGIGKPKAFQSVDIVRSGDRIILPDGMSYDDGIKWLQRQQKAEEQVINIKFSVKAFPFDGAYALYRAIQELFGFADIVGEAGPSGNSPPDMISIQIPSGEYVKVPWGMIKFPGFDDDSFVETGYDNREMKFEVKGQIRKKFQGMVDKIMEKTKQILATDSLYKGQAIRVDLGFLDKGESPLHPEYLDVSGISDDDILLNKTAEHDYSSVLLRIEQTKECLRKNIPLKHGCLLAGGYGTGKTLMARWTARKATDNGWTFIYIEDCKQINHALRLAQMYAPSVLFAEDIDKAVEGERSTSLNEILNTLDGIDTKNRPIITVLTTNHLERINKAFLRAGRIDSLVNLGTLDEETALKFIHKFVIDSAGQSCLVKGKNYKKAAKSLAGVVPAFVTEIFNKAKMSAMYNKREDNDIHPEDIEVAAVSFKEHIKLTEEKRDIGKFEKLGLNVVKVFEGLESIDEDDFDPRADD